jgi:hypothetical protein
MAWDAPLLIVVLDIERSTSPGATLNWLHLFGDGNGMYAADGVIPFKCPRTSARRSPSAVNRVICVSSVILPKPP